MNNRLVKILWSLALLWLLSSGMIWWPSNAMADATAEKDADALIATGYGYFRGIMIITDGTNAVTVSIYDNTAASGRELIPTWTVTTSATDRAQAISFAKEELYYYVGIYVDITTSGTATYMIYYDPLNR